MAVSVYPYDSKEDTQKMHTDSKDICVYSFNSRGFDEDKKDILKMISLKNKSNHPIICNQENFLLLNNRYKVKQALSNYHVIFKQAVMDSTHGRPKNGMFIAIPLELKEQVIDVSVS